jgi:hypothetical protein
MVIGFVKDFLPRGEVLRGLGCEGGEAWETGGPQPAGFILTLVNAAVFVPGCQSPRFIQPEEVRMGQIAQMVGIVLKMVIP